MIQSGLYKFIWFFETSSVIYPLILYWRDRLYKHRPYKKLHVFLEAKKCLLIESQILHYFVVNKKAAMRFCWISPLLHFIVLRNYWYASYFLVSLFMCHWANTRFHIIKCVLFLILFECNELNSIELFEFLYYTEILSLSISR
jgi:hypothetical protein